MSHTLDIQHFVFSTKERRRTIPITRREPLYRYIWSLLKNHKCHLYRINGIEDHIHMVIDLHPSLSKAKLMQEIKALSSQWMKKSGMYPLFDGWGQGYFSESKDKNSLDTVVNYVKNQLEHHKGEDFVSELKRIYATNGQPWDDRDLF